MSTITRIFHSRRDNTPPYGHPLEIDTIMFIIAKHLFDQSDDGFARTEIRALKKV